MKLIPTGRWSSDTRAQCMAVLRELLGDVGDKGRERVFRMNITLCIHRALTDEERGGLPKWWHESPAIDLAGGPVEIISETCEGAASTRPCLKPKKLSAGIPGQLEIWVPGDCGRCEPCRARAVRESRVGLAT